MRKPKTKSVKIIGMVQMLSNLTIFLPVISIDEKNNEICTLQVFPYAKEGNIVHKQYHKRDYYGPLLTLPS